MVLNIKLKQIYLQLPLVKFLPPLKRFEELFSVDILTFELCNEPYHIVLKT